MKEKNPLFVCCICTNTGAGARFARMCCCFASKPGGTFLFFRIGWTWVAASESAAAESWIYYLLQKVEPLMWLENKHFLIFCSLIVSPGCANVLISPFNCQWQVLPICFHLWRNLFEMRNCSKNRQKWQSCLWLYGRKLWCWPLSSSHGKVLRRNCHHLENDDKCQQAFPNRLMERVFKKSSLTGSDLWSDSESQIIGLKGG